ncbi:hypothetical protein C0995_006026 [Termitomyces sp. Mi166|nr:hypothetical protein C0995_006026 [Termitomyces sp. Mi166\
MPEASVYKPPPKRDDSDPRNVSASFGMPGGLSISWMKPILNSGAWSEERTFASGVLPLLVYPELPKHIGQRQRSLDSLPQFGEMAQGSAYATPNSTSANGGGRRVPVVDAYDTIPDN